MDIIQYFNSSEEKPAQYLGLLVPKNPYVSGSFSLRILLSTAGTDLTSLMWGNDRNALLSALITDGKQKGANYEIHIFPLSQNMQQLFNVREDEMPEKKALVTHLNKMLVSHTPEYVGAVTFVTPTLFNPHMDAKGKSLSDTKKRLGK